MRIRNLHPINFAVVLYILYTKYEIGEGLRRRTLLSCGKKLGCAYVRLLTQRVPKQNANGRAFISYTKHFYFQFGKYNR